MMRLSTFVSLCATLLLLAPGVSRAARPVASVAGYITEAPIRPLPGLLAIESGNEVVVLKVTRKTQLFNHPPAPPGGSEPDPELEVGRRVEGSYDPKTRLAISLGVSRLPEVIRRTGELIAVGPANTVTLDPNDGRVPEELTLQESTRLFVGSVPINPEQLDLLVGLRVDVLQLADTLKVERLRAFPPAARTAAGVVRNFDSATGKLRVSLATGVVELTLPAGLEVRAINGTVPVATLREGDRVRVISTPLLAGVQLALQIDWIGMTLRETSERFAQLNFETKTLTLWGPGPSTFRVLDEAPITFLDNGEAPRLVTLAELAVLIPQYDRLRARVAYVTRGKNRIATRLQLTGQRTPPPNPD